MTIRIGKISYWHVHAWEYTKYAQEHPDTEIAAVWDELPERGKESAEKLGVPFYDSLDDMLGSANIDAVIVDAPTTLHHEVLVKSARAGKHIFTEKVVAPTQREVNDIYAEIEKAGVTLTVSLPRLNAGYTLAIRELLEQKRLGDITLVRVRLSHDGATRGWLPAHFYNAEQTAGGAMIDLGCHPMYLTSLFLGEPVLSVTAQYGYMTGKDVEDNAVVTLQTASGAIGIVEAGFVNAHSPFAIEIHGKDGTLFYGTPQDKLLLRTNAGGQAAEGWQEIPLPGNRDNAFTQWVDHIKNGTKNTENVALAAELTRLMEASNLSARERRAVRLAELAQ